MSCRLTGIFYLFIFIIFSAALSAKPTRVYVDVVGDLFHAGHVQFFQKAKAHGDYLIVGVHGDDFSEEKMLSQYAVPIKMGIFKTVSYTPGISTTEILNRIYSYQ